MKVDFRIITCKAYSSRITLQRETWTDRAIKAGHSVSVYSGPETPDMDGFMVHRINCADDYESARDKTIAQFSDATSADFVCVCDDDSFFLVPAMVKHLKKVIAVELAVYGRIITCGSSKVPHGGAGMFFTRSAHDLCRKAIKNGWNRWHKRNSDITAAYLCEDVGISLIELGGQLNEHPTSHWHQLSVDFNLQLNYWAFHKLTDPEARKLCNPFGFAEAMMHMLLTHPDCPPRDPKAGTKTPAFIEWAAKKRLEILSAF
jgi:hypothetical protein